MKQTMDFTKLNALLEMDIGLTVDDGQGGQRTKWQKGKPVWAAVQQRLTAKTGPWEGGQADVQLTYEVITDEHTKLPPVVRFRWQRHYLHPVTPCAPWGAGPWQSVLCRLAPDGGAPHD